MISHVPHEVDIPHDDNIDFERVDSDSDDDVGDFYIEFENIVEEEECSDPQHAESSEPVLTGPLDEIDSDWNDEDVDDLNECPIPWKKQALFFEWDELEE